MWLTCPLRRAAVVTCVLETELATTEFVVLPIFGHDGQPQYHVDAALALKVALISGGARGMGAAHARALVAEGANVVVGDILDDDGRTDHRDQPHRDVSGHAAAVEPMIAAGGGSIINISSVEGLRGSPGLYGYVASKFGVRGLAKAAALELAPHNIRVNSIHPGMVRTPMTAGIPEDFLQIPLGRGADAGEVSACVVYLASDESSYSTGAEFIVDGGLTVGVPHKSIQP